MFIKSETCQCYSVMVQINQKIWRTKCEMTYGLVCQQLSNII